MATQKLYYSEPYLQEARAEILHIREEKDTMGLLLSQTIFYPGGGGQLPDQGKLAGKELQAIHSDEQGIWHWIDKQEMKPGDEVSLKLNWDWRYYQMQQHTGQHLLSYVLYLHQLQTVSVHLGEEYTLIEVDGTIPGEPFLSQIEKEANALIRQALPVRQHWISPQEADRFPLRRPPGAYEKLRIIEIDQRDFAACGGTHVGNTSEIGIIKALSWEKIRGHARLKYVIGEKAYAYFGEVHSLAKRLRDLLKIPHNEAVQRIEGLKDELTSARRQNKKLLSEITEYQARSLMDREMSSGMVVYELPGEEAQRASFLTKKIAERGQCLTFIMAGDRFFLAWPHDLIHFSGHEFVKACTQKLGLRGGGPEGFMQGKIELKDADTIRRCLKTHLQ